MNSDLSAARRYASALFEVSRKRNEVDVVAANLQEVVTATQGSRELSSVLHHPRIPRERKRAVLHGVFGGRIHKDVENFLFLVVEKQRAVLLPQILQEFNRFVDEYRGEADAEAVTAVALQPTQIAALESALQTRFGVKVRLKTRVDPNILGGLQVRVGDKLIDATVNSRLGRMNEQLKRVKVT